MFILVYKLIRLSESLGWDPESITHAERLEPIGVRRTWSEKRKENSLR